VSATRPPPAATGKRVAEAMPDRCRREGNACDFARVTSVRSDSTRTSRVRTLGRLNVDAKLGAQRVMLFAAAAAVASAAECGVSTWCIDALLGRSRSRDHDRMIVASFVHVHDLLKGLRDSEFAGNSDRFDSRARAESRRSGHAWIGTAICGHAVSGRR